MAPRRGVLHRPGLCPGEETVGGLGDGRFGSVSTATFPAMTGCGLYGPILTALMSGPGQKFDLKFAPPAPKTLQ